MVDIQVTVTGPVTINQLDPEAFVGPVLDRLATLEAAMTTPLTTIDEALTALQAQVVALSDAATADRAAFDSLATVVRAFIASVSAPGTLSPEQAAQAQAILDSLSATAAAEQAEAADETALSAEVPPVA